MNTRQSYAVLTAALLPLWMSCDSSPPRETAVAEPVLRYYQEVHNQKSFHVISEIFAPQYRSYGPGGELTARGPEGELQHMQESFEFFPDLRTEVVVVLVDAPYVAVRWRGTGTHAGQIVDLPGSSVFEVADGQIARVWHYYDNLHSFSQLGYHLSPPDEE